MQAELKGKKYGMFQFTRPRGGAISYTQRGGSFTGFNSHAPVGARFVVCVAVARMAVSIHTPPWGRDAKLRAVADKYKFQFTRPRGGAIATTSTTRATASFNSHAPVGARCHGVPVRFVAIGFNSHAPVGAR